jgi:seryl-tRNA synthetase
MTIWETAVLNMQKGSRKVMAAAAVFSERVKAEIAIVRLRIRIDEVQARIDELYRTIGRTTVELRNKGLMPETAEQLFAVDEITAALNELATRKKEIEDLLFEIKHEQDAYKPAAKPTEDAAL